MLARLTLSVPVFCLSLSAGMRFVVTPSQDQWTITDASLSFGGMAPITFVASKCCQFLIGKALGDEVIREAMNVLAEELKLPESVPGGQSQYRVTLSASFLWRSYVRLCLDLQESLEVLLPLFLFPDTDSDLV
jgi:xanthine dehydrogenase/oxidase